MNMVCLKRINEQLGRIAWCCLVAIALDLTVYCLSLHDQWVWKPLIIAEPNVQFLNV